MLVFNAQAPDEIANKDVLLQLKRFSRIVPKHELPCLRLASFQSKFDLILSNCLCKFWFNAQTRVACELDLGCVYNRVNSDAVRVDLHMQHDRERVPTFEFVRLPMRQLSLSILYKHLKNWSSLLAVVLTCRNDESSKSFMLAAVEILIKAIVDDSDGVHKLALD